MEINSNKEYINNNLDVSGSMDVSGVATIYSGVISKTLDVSGATKLYNELGFIPYDSSINENVARTLEYSYNDFSIWKLAEALNRPNKEIKLFKERANYYKNVFDPSTNFMRGRLKNGNKCSNVNYGICFTGCWSCDEYNPYKIQ